MPSEFTQRGIRLGQLAAKNAIADIRKCKNSSALARLCGSMIDKMIKESDDWWVGELHFREGFFNGFMARAEELKGDK